MDDNNEIIFFDEYISSISSNISGELKLYEVSQIFNISIYVYEFLNIEKNIDFYIIL